MTLSESATLYTYIENTNHYFKSGIIMYSKLESRYKAIPKTSF